MKTLTIYFLKRWWGFYLAIFLTDLVFAGGSPDGSGLTRGMLTLVVLSMFLFSIYLKKGGSGAFWIPLKREEIGRVYWLIGVLVPTVIFGASELLGSWLSAMTAFPQIWLPLKHSVFFMGIASLLLFEENSVSMLFSLTFLIYFQRGDFFHANQELIEIIWFIASILLIAISFIRAEFLLKKQLSAAGSKTGLTESFGFSGKFKPSKRTGMNWILTTGFQRMIVNYLIFVAIVVFFRHFTNSTFADVSFILFVLFVPSILPLFLIFNLRVARLLPFTTNKLAGLLVFLTFGAGVVVATLIAATAFFFKMHFDNLLATFLGILEGILIVQTTGFSVAGIGLRGAAAIYALVVIFIFAGFLLIYLPFVTGIRMEIPILISLPTAFLIQRYYLQNSSELYRPQKDNLSSL